MSRFLIDNQQVYSYEDLLCDINHTHIYIPLYRTNSLYDYFVNFLRALVNNKSLVLLDSDISSEELQNLGIANINQGEQLEARHFDNVTDLIGTALSSTSEITIFTSGTTGQPKKVVHSVMTLMRNVRQSEKYQEQTWLFAYNPTHMAGLQVFFQTFANQNLLINVFNKSRDFIFEQIQINQVTHISATPTFYRLLLPANQIFESVKRVTLGGEKSGEKLYEQIHILFPNAKINNIYASTEAGSLFAAKGEYFQIPSQIMDKCRVDSTGELLIHRSLLGKSDSFTFDGDYYHTGDLIEWKDEANGLFRFLSRKNELINVGGYKVNPNEVEEVIAQIPGVEQVVVYGKTNSVLGNILCAEVRKEAASNLTEVEIRHNLTDKLQDFKIPRRIKFVDQFTLTRTGKLKRK